MAEMEKYNKTNWVDGETPLNATNMNHIESGIDYLYTYCKDIDNTIDTSNFVTSESLTNTLSEYQTKLTDAQKSAVDSGITGDKVTSYDNLVNNPPKINNIELVSGGTYQSYIVFDKNYGWNTHNMTIVLHYFLDSSTRNYADFTITLKQVDVGDTSSLTYTRDLLLQATGLLKFDNISSVTYTITNPDNVSPYPSGDFIGETLYLDENNDKAYLFLFDANDGGRTCFVFSSLTGALGEVTDNNNQTIVQTYNYYFVKTN